MMAAAVAPAVVLSPPAPQHNSDAPAAAAALRKQRNDEKKKARAQNEANRLANLAKKAKQSALSPHNDDDDDGSRPSTNETVPAAAHEPMQNPTRKPAQKSAPSPPKLYHELLAAPLLAKLHSSTRQCKPKHHEAPTVSDHVKSSSSSQSSRRPTSIFGRITSTLSKDLAIYTSTEYRSDATLSARTSTSSDTLVDPLNLTRTGTRLSPPRLLSRRSAALAASPAGAMVVAIDDVPRHDCLLALIERYGAAAHGGTLDRTWSFYLTPDKDAAILFKVRDNIAVVGGDPLCRPDLFSKSLSDFKQHRKRHGWGIAFLGATDALLEHAKAKKWVTIRWGTERVLNPMTNAVLLEKATKQLIRQNKQLLDPAKLAITLDLYDPAAGRDAALERDINAVYDAWRAERNETKTNSAHTTVYDVTALPSLMLYLFTRDAAGAMNGFAALRRSGALNGYYADPVVAAPGAPRRIPDLLYFSSMAVLHGMGVAHLSLGTEAAAALTFTGLAPRLRAWGSGVYAALFDSLKLGGKREYYDKFRPDPAQEAAVHMVFAARLPSIRHVLAVCHVSNIGIRKIVWDKMDVRIGRKSKGGAGTLAVGADAQAVEVGA